MKPKNIVLIRHGESVGNVDKEIYKTIPDYALQLTDKGKQQAIDAGNNIKLLIGSDSVKFYISPFWRTRQTYEGLAKSFPASVPYEDPRLREQEWHGKLPVDGYMSAYEMERDSYGHFYYRFDGGESCADVFDRISSFLDTMFRDFDKATYPETAIIVTHGMTLRVFLMRFLHLSVEEFEMLHNPDNCGIVALSLNKNNKYELVTPLKKYKSPKHKYQFKWNSVKT